MRWLTVKGRGDVTITVLVMMLILLTIATAWLQFTNLNYKATVIQEASDRSFFVAEAGLDYGVNLAHGLKLGQIGACTASQLADSRYVQNVAGGIFELKLSGGLEATSTGWYGDRCSKVIADISSYDGVFVGPHFYYQGVTEEQLSECPPKPEFTTNECSGTVFFDGFNCSSIQLLQNDPPDIGDGWTQDPSGAFLVTCSSLLPPPHQNSAGLNCGFLNTEPLTARYEAVVDIPGEDYTVSVTNPDGFDGTYRVYAKSDLGDFGKTSGYEAVWSPDNSEGDSGIYKDGELVAAVTVDVSVGSRVTLSISGSEIRMLAGSVQVASFTDSDPIVDAGTAGMGYTGCIYEKLDDFTITML